MNNFGSNPSELATALVDRLLERIVPEDWALWLLAGGIISIGLFLLMRELICWYWKITKIHDLLEKIEENTRKK
jgi:hypothetical protein